MSKTDIGLLALTLLALMMGVVGLTAQDPDPMSAGLALGMLALLANGATLIRRSRAPEPRRERGRADELDASRVLDLDARLEALEHAQHDAVDAARWRALVESGQVTGPGAEPLASPPGDRRNGAADRA